MKRRVMITGLFFFVVSAVWFPFAAGAQDEGSCCNKSEYPTYFLFHYFARQFNFVVKNLVTGILTRS